MILTTGELGCLLIGLLLGAGLVIVAGFLVLGVNVWREGIREGTPIVGEELERNRKRGVL